ncbi:MAG: helix-turn-helix domain-containing protein [Halobacteriales archaeon]|nr:helix-turn-helix domain-containing protein [Halobacteriales archaeon]
MILSEPEMRRAVLRRDRALDGRFFIAITTTRIYCKPSCPSRRARPEHVRFYATRDEAERAGFRACKRCTPQLASGEAEDALLARVHAAVDAAPDRASLASVSAQLGTKPETLRRRVRRAAGVPWTVLVRRRRVLHAATLLVTTDAPVVDVARAAGFRSLSTFYAAFRRAKGVPPAAYRKSGGSLHA